MVELDDSNIIDERVLANSLILNEHFDTNQPLDESDLTRPKSSYVRIDSINHPYFYYYYI